MVSPTKIQMRSPLKETDANLKQLNQPAKKRLFEAIGTDEQSTASISRQTIIKKPKIERTRSIEGAVLVSKKAALKTIEPKIPTKDLIEWQNNWRRILKNDAKIYFDTTEDPETTSTQKKLLDKRQELLRRGFLSLGATITAFFDNSVTIVITRRETENKMYYSATDVLRYAKRHYMKIWKYEKATRFLGNLDIDLEEVAEKYEQEINVVNSKTTTLSNLLQNEKLYGPNDRDPRTKRDDTHYFKYPHVYMFDLWQTWSPIIALEWKPSAFQKEDEYPYPVLKFGSFGRCPFVGDRNCQETSYKRVIKRYARDKMNKKYAINLRKLYQLQASPYPISNEDIIFLPHDESDSRDSYLRWQRWKREAGYREDHDDHSLGDLSNENNNNPCISNDTSIMKEVNQEIKKITQRVQPAEEVSINEASKNYSQLQAAKKGSVYKEPPTPKLKRPILASFTRQETEEFFPDDLCNSRKQSHINYEIKASGAHQSNDVATSFGNGLAPTKASVMSKNIKSLSRFVVDRKLTTPNVRKLGTGNSQRTQSTSNLNKETNPIVDDKNKQQTTSVIDLTAQNKISKSTPEKGNINKDTNAAAETNKETPVQTKVEPKNSGYCENCRVKYDSLESHIVSEKHITFAEDPMNFEAIDTLIGKLKFQF
ncbi:hypothetical protein C6P45_002261 [Maudiozyma exigua]|uniref:DBF4-type domain-containing protein n=1 Tax=Maudiozyma exigua TaxID=34358 RepID=A0A9P6WEZ0_MAUEX|nr:hypothetical protein C6P45_002261 [Kazachstania exigua]